MHWKLKAAAFQLLSAIPWGEEIHYWLQKNATKTLPRCPEVLDSCIENAREILGAFRRHSAVDIGSSVFLEFGAGRDLAVPIALCYMGVHKVLVVDIEPIAKLDLVRASVAHMAARFMKDKPLVTSFGDLEINCGVRYEAPLDMRHTFLPEKSLNCVFSRDTLEHIPLQDIKFILAEVRRVLEPEGIIIMKIDYGDHYSRSDQSISAFNFLKFSDGEWERFNSSV